MDLSRFKEKSTRKSKALINMLCYVIRVSRALSYSKECPGAIQTVVKQEPGNRKEVIVCKARSLRLS